MDDITKTKAGIHGGDKLFVANTWFWKKAEQRWVWIALNAENKNEIEHVWSMHFEGRLLDTLFQHRKRLPHVANKTTFSSCY